MSVIGKFFTNLFSRKKDKKLLIPCDHISCSHCVYFDHRNMECAISNEDIQTFQTRYNVDDINKFIKK
jgi:hypothetical protein